ncbi:MAG TPA: chorismate synthase [Bacteroidia bacterium]|nr:chorismate synthase [Bacteroidia bacterium]
MPSNSFGTIFRLSTFGESHGEAIGGVLEGCPAGLHIDMDFINAELARRKPGQSDITTTRHENDTVQFLSGIFEGKSTGTPIGFILKNQDTRSSDYTEVKDVFRPSHADYTYQVKFGHRDHRGGGRSSARETACRVVAGALAKLFLRHYHIQVHAFVKQVGTIILEKNFDELNLKLTDKNKVRCPHQKTAALMIGEIEKARAEGDSLGGIIQGVVLGLPPGLGEPVFDKLPAVMAHAMMSINAVKGFEIGAGFSIASKKGSEVNDSFIPGKRDALKTSSNNSGGVLGGISNGMPFYFNLAFKPVSTIMKLQKTVNIKGKSVDLLNKGRHDPCVLPRAVPVVESMAALVIADMLLLARTSRL